MEYSPSNRILVFCSSKEIKSNDRQAKTAILRNKANQYADSIKCIWCIKFIIPLHFSSVTKNSDKNISGEDPSTMAIIVMKITPLNLEFNSWLDPWHSTSDLQNSVLLHGLLQLCLRRDSWWAVEFRSNLKPTFVPLANAIMDENMDSKNVVWKVSWAGINAWKPHSPWLWLSNGQVHFLWTE